MQIKCTSCGATQELAANHQCGYCGSAIEQEKAQENYKSSTTGEVGNLMMMAETAVDATNWEEALQYYNKVLEKDITNSDAWLGKGIAMVYTSKIGDIKTKEAIAYWKNAIKHAENADAMGKRVAKEINTVVNAFYPAIENHYIEFSGLDNSYQELVSRFATLENAQDYATQLDNDNITFHETGYALCKRVIDLPKKYASAAHSSALAEGIVGQFTSNEYSRKYAAQDARDKMNKANARKAEIEEASRLISILLTKYSDSLFRLGHETEEHKRAEESFKQRVASNEMFERNIDKIKTNYLVLKVSGVICLAACLYFTATINSQPTNLTLWFLGITGAISGLIAVISQKRMEKLSGGKKFGDITKALKRRSN
jgi:tetratricopeptide (TPR) repeat protein